MSDSIKINIDSNVDEIIQKVADAAKSEIKDFASSGPFEIDCPDCGKRIEVRPGHNVCPFCHEDINVTVDLDI